MNQDKPKHTNGPWIIEEHGEAFAMHAAIGGVHVFSNH